MKRVVPLLAVIIVLEALGTVAKGQSADGAGLGGTDHSAPLETESAAKTIPKP